jgi:crotonobetainyl-CoA:carnitine CoA-transferase CaiB-like acyl-CoA transferase
MADALDGLTVLDLGTGPAAALATMFLSDHGARVIRIVDKGAALVREGGFVVWDRGKELVTLDLDAVGPAAGLTAEARPGSPADLFRRLVAGADVLVEDFAPSSPRQRLVDATALRRLNGRLVTCSITAYGKRGPWQDEPAIDDLVLARTGILAGMPGFRPAPVHVVHPLPSVGAALLATIGISAALLARETTGRGRAIETSLMAGALVFATKVTGTRLARHVFQTHPSGSAPFYSVYRCADGQWVQLGCVHAGFVATAAKLMGIGELLKEPRFDTSRGPLAPEAEEEMRATLTRIIGARPYAEWAKAFEEADVPFAPARLTEEGLDDPQVVHNGMVQRLDDPVLGPVVQMGVPIEMSATPGRIRGPRAGTADAISGVPAGYAELQPAPVPAEALEPPPLAGVRILEISNLIAGPTTGRLLADLGADVVKLEPPEGDMSRPIGRTYFYWVNFNKRSISVDTRTPDGKAIVQKIAATADAMIANLRPLATERMGIGPESHPNLIETHVTGYGWTGPYSKRPGIDPLAQALMGLQRAQGGPGNPPVFPAQLAPTDFTTGAMGALGTILALFACKRTGVVQRVDCNLLSGGILLSSAWFSSYAGKPERPLADKGQYGLGPFHRLYRLADGWIYVVAESEDRQKALCAWAGVDADEHPVARTTAGRHANDTPLALALAEALSARGLAETCDVLRRAQVPHAVAPAADSEVFLTDQHALANDHLASRRHAKAGELQVAWQLVQTPGSHSSAGLPTPLLGEHSEAVLREIGYDAAEIAALRALGVIKVEAI